MAEKVESQGGVLKRKVRANRDWAVKEEQIRSKVENQERVNSRERRKISEMRNSKKCKEIYRT